MHACSWRAKQRAALLRASGYLEAVWLGRPVTRPFQPPFLQRGVVGEIISRFERKGFQLKALKLYQTPREVAEEHYKDLKSKPFYKASGAGWCRSFASPSTRHAVCMDGTPTQCSV